MSLKQRTQQLLEKYDITPNKVLGQNFLIDELSVKDFVGTANITEQDLVLEVGPGTGTITKELAKHANRVLAIEKDPNMVKILENELKDIKNVEIINGDILKLEIGNLNLTENWKLEIGNSNYKLVGAPPYYLTGRLFRKFLEEAEIKPKLISVIIQKEVAEKICAKPPDMNLLAVSVQLYGMPKIVKKVPKSFFWPQPKVDSSILNVEDIKDPDINEERFFKVVRAGFSAPRKQLLSNLSSNLDLERAEIEKILKKCGVSPKRRAETLSVEDWKSIYSALPHKNTKDR